jgi:hypothetical protein
VAAAVVAMAAAAVAAAATAAVAAGATKTPLSFSSERERGGSNPPRSFFQQSYRCLIPS